MHPLYDEFIALFDQGNKEKCVELAISRLHDGSIDVVSLYNEILTPALYAQFCKPQHQDICIWEEHVRTSIIRTIIEGCFPFVIKERDQKYRSGLRGKVIILCPPGELHEIGARMVSDFFTILGFDAVFVGANTPQEDIIGAIGYIQPQYVAISITVHYNLIAARNAIQKIIDLRGTLTFKVILGGQACLNNPEICRQMNADMILGSFEDIQRLAEGKNDAVI